MSDFSDFVPVSRSRSKVIVEEAAPASAPSKGPSVVDFGSFASTAGTPAPAAAPKADPFSPEALAADNRSQLLRDLFGYRKDWTVENFAKETGRTAVGLTDMVLSVPAQVGSVGADLGMRGRTFGAGKGRREVSQAGFGAATAVNEELGSPLAKALKVVGLDPNGNTPTALDAGMTKLTELIKRGGKWVEEKTGGALLQEDVESIVNAAMAAGGARGIEYGLKKMMPPATPEGTKFSPGMIRKFEEQKAREEAAGRPAREEAARAADTPPPDAPPPPSQIWRSEGVDTPVELVRGDTVRDANGAIYQRVRNPGSAKEYYVPATELASAVKKTRIADPTVIGEIPPMQGEGLPKPKSLDTAMEKVTNGRAFDLTAEERIAMRGWEKEAPPSPILNESGTPLGRGTRWSLDKDGRLMALGAGAVAAGALLDDETRGDVVAASAGAFLVRKGGERGLNLEQFRELSPTLALGALLERSDYTLKTLDRLDQTKIEFSKAHLEQELKRQDVTDAERAAIKAALATTDGPKISAKDLMVGVKEATGDFEFVAEKTYEYADDGLGRIDRGLPDRDALEDIITDTQVLQEQLDDYPAGALTTPEQRAQAEQRLAAARSQLAAVNAAEQNPPQTTLYRLPANVKVSRNNHFADDRLFGWTRSFTEGGVRHVVEIQSDLAQHTKVLHAEDRAQMEQELAGARKEMEAINRDFSAAAQAYDKANAENIGRVPPQELLDLRALRNGAHNELRSASLRVAELQAKLQESVGGELLAPIVKNWPKRLVREELADAQRALNGNDRNDLFAAYEAQNDAAAARVLDRPTQRSPFVRFATADTVAKVEGWPKRTPAEFYEDAYLDAVRAGQPRNIIDRFARAWDEAKARAGEPKFSPEHQSIYDRYAKDIEKFLNQLGGKPYTDSAGHTWIEVPLPKKRGPTQMYGRADPDLVRAMAAAGVGAGAAAYFADGDVASTVAGGLAGLGLKAYGGKIATAADYGLGAISTRIGNISPVLKKRLRDFEHLTLQESYRRIKEVEPFLLGLKKLPKAQEKALDLALTSNDPQGIAAALAGAPSLAQAWATTQRVLRETGEKLVEHRIIEAGSLRDNYFPRVVNDREGLAATLNSQARVGLEQRLAEAEAKAAKATGHGLTPLEQSIVINQFLRGLRTHDFAPGFTKGRKITSVTEALRPFYASPAEAIHTYLASATRSIEKARLFGRDLVRDPATGHIQTDASIGELVRQELRTGKITNAQASELESILSSRFGAGERLSNPLLQAAKNLTNAGLLGNVVSAATQLGDALIATYAHGTRPALEAVVRTLAGKRRVTAREFGLVNHISEEFANTAKSAKFLNAAFKWNGFSAVDLFGKSINLEAAFTNATRKAQTPRGEAALQKKYGEAYGTEFPQLIADLRSGKPTDRVRAMLFSELSDLQPISKAEMPQGYLDMPNGRMVYMLKTFMLKQVDLVRRDAYNEIRQGNVAKGLYNLARYGLVLGIAGMATDKIKDWMLGKAVSFANSDIAMNMIKTFGWSDWVREDLRKGQPIQAVGRVVLPPYRMWEDLYKAAGGGDLSPKARQEARNRAVQYLGTPGKLFYYHYLGGAKKADAAEAKAKKREATRERKERSEK